MIALVQGRIAEKGPAGVIIDANGVGYELAVPTSVLARLGEVGEMARLRTFLEVREDAMLLYGFLERTELEIFRLLISVPGVGPRLAIAVLSAMTPAQVLEAVAREDEVSFSRVRGIGRKTAAKLLFELRSRVKDLPPLAPSAPASASRAPWAEATEALRSLGYKESEISESLAWAGRELGTADLEVTEVLRKALTYFQQSVTR